MKRCPECRRDYYDDTLRFCLDDGNVLLDGPGTQDQITVPFFDPQVAHSAPTLEFRDTQPFPSASAYETTETSPPNSVAVLPFVNIGSNEDLEYFSTGLAEELLTVLSKIKGLQVAARTSAFSFIGKSMTIKEIGGALKVRSVVEGSIRMAGKRMRIAVQLVNVEDGFHLWSETYDRTMDDVFEVQDDIARSVVEEMRTMLLGPNDPGAQIVQVQADVEEAVKGRASDPEAQRLMLLGRYFLDRTTREDFEKAIGYFQKALEIDPDYALCWAELGRAHAVSAGKAWAPTDEAFARAREAIDKALSLEPDLAEAHAQSGRISGAADWDLSAAKRSYERALELAPGSSVVQDGASVLFLKLGDLERSMELSRAVLKQDPLNGAVWHNLGLIAYCEGNFAESEEAFAKALEVTPRRSVSAAMRSLALLDDGKADEALECAALEPDEFWRTWANTILAYRLGRIEESQEHLNKLIDIHTGGDAFQVAEVLSARGENDGAFEMLERAIAERDPGLTHALVDRHFLPLHEDPRWADFLKRVGLDAVR